MSLARLSAGSGYRYLLKHTACGDCGRDAGTSLTSYYAESGYPAGRWSGSGLAGLDGGRGLAAGSIVTEEAMAALYGRGHDPISGAALGRAFPVYRSTEERIADAVGRLPGALAGVQRQAAIEAIETRERARPVKAAVAGFDLTFTAPKSASVLWALGNRDIRRAVADAHRESVTAVLALIEDRFLHTRIGANSCAQVATRGMIAAAFDHWDTRTGDPNLHTHVVIANKVQGPDGRWRSVDGQAIYRAAVACSETYDALFADALSARLPIVWGLRDRGDRRNPAFEIAGVEETLLELFSSRAGQIDAQLRGLVGDFTAKRGRDPNRREMLRLRQQATLASRPDKKVAPLATLLNHWRIQATELTGRQPAALVADALSVVTAPLVTGPVASTPVASTPVVTGPVASAPVASAPVASAPVASASSSAGPATVVSMSSSGRAVDIPVDIVEQAARTALAAVAERRSTWTRNNLLAEAARATRLVRVCGPRERFALLDRVVETAVGGCVALDPPELFTSPARFRRADGTSAFSRPDEHAYTTTAVLAAEERLVAATAIGGAPRLSREDLAAAAARIPPGASGGRLSGDQQAAVVALATSGRRVAVLVGPAGTGKTRTLRALRAGWEHVHGVGSVRGLAPSATAAAELAAALGVACENTAKWLYESCRDDADPRWTLRPGQLLIVDEASMVPTRDLDALAAQTAAAGAKLVLVGDHHQLNPVGAGGVFALLADQPHTVHLTGLWRFAHRWEAHATRGLRRGHADVLDAYAEHDRLHGGPGELMIEAAYTAWAADVAEGHSAVLLATDRATVAALNQRAHDDRVDAGLVRPDGIALADDTVAGVGDIVVTRRNDRRLLIPGATRGRAPDRTPGATGDEYVRNGALWQITAAHADGSIQVRPLPRPSAGIAHPATIPPQSSGMTGPDAGVPGTVCLPSEYVRRHVELGYAATVHRAQGMTVERGHALVQDGMSRQQLYVAMTRGQTANHAYAALDGLDLTCSQPPDQHPIATVRQVLEKVLATDGGELSATATLRRRHTDATSLRRLLPIRDTLTAAGETGDPDSARSADQIRELLRLRAARARQAPVRRSGSGVQGPPAPSPHSTPGGIHR